jgi:hypothetical protein
MGRRLAAQGIQLSRRTMVRAAVAGGAAAAGALLSGCGSSGSARPSRETVTQTAAAKATSAAFASWALGDWRVYHWFAGDEGPLGENTAMLAAKGVRTYTELADLLDDPAVAAAGGPGWDRVLGVAADSYTVGQSARDSDDLGWSGAWAMTPQGPQITLDLGSTTLDVLGPGVLQLAGRRRRRRPGGVRVCHGVVRLAVQQGQPGPGDLRGPGRRGLPGERGVPVRRQARGARRLGPSPQSA